MHGGTKPTTGTTTAIHVRHLTKTYPGGVEAVRGLDFDVASGEVFGLLGPNGAGKSTTVGMLTTTIVPTSGVARLGGYDVATEPLAARRMTILLTTHNLDEAEQLCDRIAIVADGHVVALDSPAALLTGLGREIVEVRLDGNVDDALAALRRSRLTNDATFVVGATVHIPVRDGSARDAVAAIDHAGVPTRAISSRAPTLDDVYLQLTGRSLVQGGIQ